jgi:hypothetical protein
MRGLARVFGDLVTRAGVVNFDRLASWASTRIRHNEED